MLLVGEDKPCEFFARLRQIGLCLVKFDLERLWVYFKQKIAFLDGLVRANGDTYNLTGNLRCYGHCRRADIGIILAHILPSTEIDPQADGNRDDRPYDKQNPT